MSKNILELLVDSVWDCGVTACRMISKALGLNWNEHDFQRFFNVVQLKNSEGISPKLIKKSNDNIYKIYTFDIPVGLTLKDFNSKLGQLSFFMKTNEESLGFEVLEDLSGVQLKVLCFNEFFRLYEFKNSDGVHPKFKNKNSEELYDTYIFDKPKGLSKGDFEKKFVAFPEYLKIQSNEIKLCFAETKGCNDIELRIYK